MSFTASLAASNRLWLIQMTHSNLEIRLKLLATI